METINYLDFVTFKLPLFCRHGFIRALNSTNKICAYN